MQIKNLCHINDKLRRITKQDECKTVYMRNYGSKLGIKFNSKSFRMVFDELEYKINEVNLLILYYFTFKVLLVLTAEGYK
jgi:hypothetical protein